MVESAVLAPSWMLEMQHSRLGPGKNSILQIAEWEVPWKESNKKEEVRRSESKKGRQEERNKGRREEMKK